MHSSLETPSPSLEQFAAFFADERITGALATAMADGASVTFVLEIQGDTHAWTVHRQAGCVDVRPGDRSGADCTLTCTGDDFRALLVGELGPRTGFLERRLDVSGDVGIVLELRRAVRRVEHQESA